MQNWPRRRCQLSGALTPILLAIDQDRAPKEFLDSAIVCVAGQECGDIVQRRIDDAMQRKICETYSTSIHHTSGKHSDQVTAQIRPRPHDRAVPFSPYPSSALAFNRLQVDSDIPNQVCTITTN
jgi:hypothetical protein